MQSDQLIWDTIAESFCSFKVKTVTQSFCRNEYNVTGLCDRESCPLANSRYATIKEKEGVLYLCVKTIERAHTPKRMWEKIKLSKNFTKALAQIDEELIFWPEQMILKCKQRMTKIKQYLVRMRRLRSKTTPKLVSVKKKIDRREARREQKAEQAARLEMSIEKELLNRLRQGVYGSDGIVNESQEAFAEALDEIEEMYEQDQDLEDEELDREFVSDISDDEDDIEDGPSFQFSDEDSLDDEDEKPKKKRSHVQVEYEQERETNVVS